MAAGLFEFTKPWKRDYAPVFGKRMPYWPSRAVPAIRLRRESIAARKQDTMTRLCAHDVLIRHFINYTANSATVLLMCGTINAVMRRERWK